MTVAAVMSDTKNVAVLRERAGVRVLVIHGVVTESAEPSP
jgi:hypothetical protein